MVCGTTILCGLLLPCCANQESQAAATTALERYSYAETHMGVPFRISVYASDKVVANKAVSEAYKRIAVLDSVFSDYKSDSEITKLRAVEPNQSVRISTDLHGLLKRSLELSKRTNGTFDVTVGPLVRLWRRSRRRKRLPEPELLKKALAATGARNLHLGPRNIEFAVPGMRLDFGAIAKGFACDEALKVLQKHGLRRALIDGGGDILVGEPPVGRTSWRIQVESEDKGEAAPLLILRNQAVATSGDRYRFVQIAGKKYSHIVDPRTGLGLTSRLTVTIVASNGTDADGLASAVSVLGVREGLRLVESLPNTECAIRDYSKDKVQVTRSTGFARHVSSVKSEPSPAGRL